MKVYVVWDPLYEEVISVHKTAEGAEKKCEEIQKPRDIEYQHRVGKFGIYDIPVGHRITYEEHDLED